MPWMTKVIAGLAMYRAVETHCHIVQNMSVAAENEEALIEWLIINTCMDGWAISTTLRLTLSLMSE
jgi:hypothetical protein